MKRDKTTDIQLVVGGESRVDLLPPEVARRAKSRSTRRALVGAVAVTALLVAGGYAYALFTAGASTVRLALEQEKTSALIAQQAEYVEIRQVDAELLGAEAAKAVGASTEIDWKSYFQALHDAMPEGSSLRALTVESATPIEAAASATEIPLRQPNVATLTMEASSPAVIDVKTWMEALQSLPGFVDAIPKTATRQDDGGYRATVIVHVNEAAYWNRFIVEETPDTDAATATETSESDK